MATAKKCGIFKSDKNQFGVDLGILFVLFLVHSNFFYPEHLSWSFSFYLATA